MKALIIGDGNFGDLSAYKQSILNLPIINIPIWGHLTHFLSHELITDVGVVFKNHESVINFQDSDLQFTVLFSNDQIINFVDTETIIIPGNILPDISLYDLVYFYEDNKNKFTLILPPDNNNNNLLAIIEPEIFQVYPSLIENFYENNFDFLWRSSIRPIVYDPIGKLEIINNWKDFFQLNMKFLAINKADEFYFGKNGFWIAEEAKIHKKSYIIPPVIIGNNCKIESDVYISGPLIVGDNVIIKSHSSLSDCILLDSAFIPENSNFEGKVIGDNWIEQVSVYSEVIENKS